MYNNETSPATQWLYGKGRQYSAYTISSCGLTLNLDSDKSCASITEMNSVGQYTLVVACAYSVR